MFEIEWINLVMLSLACWKVSDWLIGIANWVANVLVKHIESLEKDGRNDNT